MLVECDKPVGIRPRGRGGEVPGDGEGGGGHEMPVPQPVVNGQPAEGGGEKTGGEGVPGADMSDDVDAGRGRFFSPSGV